MIAEQSIPTSHTHCLGNLIINILSFVHFCLIPYYSPIRGLPNPLACLSLSTCTDAVVDPSTAESRPARPALTFLGRSAIKKTRWDYGCGPLSLSQTWPRSRRKLRVKLPEVTQDNCLIFQIWIKHAQSHCALDFVQCWEYGMERDRWDWHMIPVDLLLLLLSLPLLLFVISLPLPPPLTHSLPNLTGGEREGTGHSPPPLPIFCQCPTRQQSQSTQDMGEKTTDSSVRLD